MNRRMIAYVLGRILVAEAALMLPAMIVGLIYREDALRYFLFPVLLLLAVGVLLGRKRPEDSMIFARDGFFIVAASWILLSLVGALPLWLSGGFQSVWDCLFEIVSGFTTTGATVLAEVEHLPKCILFWRSFTHWIGGMGVLVFVLAIAPLADNRSLHLMRAEVPGPVVGKLVPRMRDTAKILYGVYSALTLVLIGLLLLGGMPLFDAVCHAFGAAGTGGFSVKTAGIAFYDSAYIEIVLGIFMLLFGVNFNLYYLILIGRAKEALRSEELRWYAAIVALSTAAIALNLLSLYEGAAVSLRHAFFQVSSIITTTGYATVDFAAHWPQFAQHALLLLMVVGACAGSTGGGLKVSRLILLLKSFAQELRRLLHPRSVGVVRLDRSPVDAGTLSGTRIYFVTYVLIICASTLLLSLDGLDFATNFAAELACFNNIGPGIGLVGPMGNYSVYSPFSKMLLTLNMLLGRLEIFPLLILFSPVAWRRNVV
ncbi:MAG: TrkH family potassium uptake protein [Clostridia bacterium]|nr:TrkH family potassium uptake protein [Clostridia bacterium]